MVLATLDRKDEESFLSYFRRLLESRSELEKNIKTEILNKKESSAGENVVDEKTGLRQLVDPNLVNELLFLDKRIKELTISEEANPKEIKEELSHFTKTITIKKPTAQRNKTPRRERSVEFTLQPIEPTEEPNGKISTESDEFSSADITSSRSVSPSPNLTKSSSEGDKPGRPKSQPPQRPKASTLRLSSRPALKKAQQLAGKEKINSLLEARKECLDQIQQFEDFKPSRLSVFASKKDKEKMNQFTKANEKLREIEKKIRSLPGGSELITEEIEQDSLRYKPLPPTPASKVESSSVSQQSAVSPEPQVFPQQPPVEPESEAVTEPAATQEGKKKSKKKGKWQECQTEDGKTYWYNSATKETTWENPVKFRLSRREQELFKSLQEQLDQSDLWQEFQTEEGVKYWYNKQTGESTWDNPFETST